MRMLIKNVRVISANLVEPKGFKPTDTKKNFEVFGEIQDTSHALSCKERIEAHLAEEFEKIKAKAPKNKRDDLEKRKFKNISKYFDKKIDDYTDKFVVSAVRVGEQQYKDGNIRRFNPPPVVTAENPKISIPIKDYDRVRLGAIVDLDVEIKVTEFQGKVGAKIELFGVMLKKDSELQAGNHTKETVEVSELMFEQESNENKVPF